MYEQFFELRERPFDLTPSPRFLVLTDSHREALSNLEYGIASRKGITLLIGEAGAGKTTLIRTAIERQSAQVHCVHLSNPTLTREEFIEMLAAKFDLTSQAATSKASPELLEEIRLLANIETNDEKLMSLILAGQPELAGRLNAPALRQLKQRIALRCELKPLSLPETAAYLVGRIRAAGGRGAQVFTREAVALIHERSHGLPRTINVIADNALVSGFALGTRPVGRQVVREVCQDFDLDAGSVPAAGLQGSAAPSRPLLVVAPPAEGKR